MIHRLTGLCIAYHFASSRRDKLAIWHRFRHCLMQGSRDYARRGLTNREGRNNRRWRQHWRESAPERAGTIVWPDYSY